MTRFMVIHSPPPNVTQDQAVDAARQLVASLGQETEWLNSWWIAGEVQRLFCEWEAPDAEALRDALGPIQDLLPVEALHEVQRIDPRWYKEVMKAPQAVLKRLEEIRVETLRRLDGLSQAQLDRRPPHKDGEEAWSLGEVFMHLAIDEFYLRELIARPLLEGIKPPDGVRFLPPPPPYGTEKAVIQFWFDRARLGTRRIFESWPPDANLDLSHEGGLEAMNGLGWFEGYAGHEAFHHRQMDDLMSQLVNN